MKTAETIEQGKNKADSQSSDKPKKLKRGTNPRSLANLVAPWTAETRPKSPGRPKDTAAEIARKAFENNQEEIYKAYVKALLGGNAYAFDVLANRGFGKLKETHEHNLGPSIVERLSAGRKRLINVK